MTPGIGPRSATWTLSVDLYEIARFLTQRWYWRLHWALWREYRKHGLSHREGSFTYGETATSSVVEVLERLDLEPGQKFVDLGSGRGLPCLVAASLGIESHGLEYFSEHVVRSQRVADRLRVPAYFYTADFLTETWPEAAAYFTCSTAFQPDLRARLEERFLQLPIGTSVVTEDWELGKGFYLDHTQKLPVTWGTATFRFYIAEGNCQPGPEAPEIP